MTYSKRFSKFCLKTILSVSLVGGMIVGSLLTYITLTLPSVATLKDMHAQIPLQIYSSDELLISEYGEKHMIPENFSDIPVLLMNAVLATEDKRYFEHGGIDVFGLGRAALKLILTGKKSEGGSTITMQVARNFFLTREKTYWRKLREILLALKIDREINKQKILELYFNNIFLGHRAYGFAAAAQVYYGKPLDQLSVGQYAMLAGLPKAPSALNPLSDPIAAKKRRDHVLERMYISHYIDESLYRNAIAEPITAEKHALEIQLQAPYVAEMVRQQLTNMYGDEIYTQGLKVYTTLDSQQQKAANQAVQRQVMAYSRRHGYFGPVRNLLKDDLNDKDQWQSILNKMQTVHLLEPAAVLDVTENTVKVLRRNGENIVIEWEGLKWACPALRDGKVGPLPIQASDILKVGDVIYMNQSKNKSWELAQVPKAEAALVALNPDNGAITALVGGFNFSNSKFNRITQANRQPGSSFKPFIYSAALSKNYTLASIINDAPIVTEGNGDHELWRPKNSTGRFYGLTRLRVALSNSQNMVSIRLLESIGVPYTIQYATRFGFEPENLPNNLSLALGTGATTPLTLASAYAVFANGGFKTKPFIIDHIVDEKGKIIFQANPPTVCAECNPEKPTDYPDKNVAPSVITPENAYLMTSALKDAIQNGTGKPARVLNRQDIAGKTGTTNEQMDAWFAGFNRHVVAVAWLGFDTPSPLDEYGAEAALPIWIDFMGKALSGMPQESLPQPPGIVSVLINAITGKRALPHAEETLLEVFQKDTVPDFDEPPVAKPTASFPLEFLGTPQKQKFSTDHEALY